VRKFTLYVVSKTSGSMTSSSCSLGGVNWSDGNGDAVDCGGGGGGGGQPPCASAPPTLVPPFSCAEADGDPRLNITDAIRLICVLFQGGGQPYDISIPSVTKTMQVNCFNNTAMILDPMTQNPICPTSGDFAGQDGLYESGDARFSYAARFVIADTGIAEDPPSPLDDTVTDNATGLMWTRSHLTTPAAPPPPGGWTDPFCVPADFTAQGTNTMVKIQADKAIAELQGFGGFNDWRLPRGLELLSIAHYEIASVAYDVDIFNAPAGLLRFMSEDYIDETDFELMQVHYTDGHLNRDTRCTPLAVRAVRRVGFKDPTLHANPTQRSGPSFKYGDANADGQTNISDAQFMLSHLFQGGPEPCNVYSPMSIFGLPEEFVANNRFVATDNGNTVTDAVTGLMWVKAPPTTRFDWKAALNQAESLDFANHQDWRLPNVAEIATLMVYGEFLFSLQRPAEKRGQFFPDAFDVQVQGNEGRFFWTATTWDTQTDKAFKADFNSGIVHNGSTLATKKSQGVGHEPARVWAVRGPVDGR